MFMKHAQRGSTLVETTLFLPVVLLALFAVLYFARFGVLAERAQSAVRYGAVVAYQSTNVYSATNIYAALQHGGAPAGLCTSDVSTATANALDGPRANAPTQAFWSSDTAPTASCTLSTVGFNGASWAAFHYFTVTQHQVNAAISPPAYLSSLLGSTGTVSASLGFLHSDPPGVIMYCTSAVGAPVAAALNATYAGGGSC